MSVRKKKQKPKPKPKGKVYASVCAVIGVLETGKSHFADRYIAKLSKPTFVVTQDGTQKQWDGLDHIDPSDTQAMREFLQTGGMRKIELFRLDDKVEERFCEYINKNSRNCTVVFDDCPPYMDPNINNVKGLRQMLGAVRHHNRDVVFILWDFEDIPRRAWSFIKWVILFKTASDPDKKLKLNATQRAKLLAAKEKVDANFQEKIKLKAKNQNSKAHYGQYMAVDLLKV